MSKRSYFSLYQSPNIVVVPTIPFANNTANKKMKLDTGNNDAGPTNKIANTSDKVKTSYEQFKDSTLIKNTNKTDTKGISTLPSKNLIVDTKNIKLNRLKPISPCMRNLSNLVDLNKKSNTSLICKVINKQSEPGDKTDINHISHSRPISKSEFNCKVHKNTAEDKNKHQLINNKCSSKKQIKINNEIKDNTESAGAILQRKDNINIEAPRKLKTLKKYDAYKNKVMLDNSHCEKIDSKHTNKTKHKSRISIKQGNTNENPSIKKMDKNKQAVLKLEKICDKKNSQILDKGSGNNTEVTCGCEIKNKSIKNDATKHKTKIYKRTNEKNVLNSNSKKLSKHKSFVNETVPKDSTKNKHQISSKQSLSDDKCKLKKVESKNNSKHNNNKLKLNLIKKNNNIKKSSHIGNHQNNSQKKVPLDNTQNDDTYGATKKGSLMKLSNVHKGKKIKLIFNLVIAPSSKNTSNTVDNNTSPESSSDISFLDDINIDEIVESLKQFQDITDVTNQEIGKNIEHEPNINHLSINNATNEYDGVNNGCNNNTKGDSKLSTIKLENELNDENAKESENVSASHIIDKNMLHNRASISVTNKSIILLEENKKADNIVNLHKKTIEVNDCSASVTETLCHSNIKAISDTKTKVKEMKPVETTKGNMYQKSQNGKCLKDQSKEIRVSNDPIEEQLCKMFEMNKNSSGAQANNRVNDCTIIDTLNADTVGDTPKTKQIVEQSNQSSHCNPHNCSETQINVGKSSHSLKKEIKSAVITPMALKQKKSTEMQKHTTVDANLGNQTKNMKSEVIKVTKKQKLVTLEDDNFTKSLEERMFVFLDERYTVTKLIHVGNFSKIYQCKDSSGSDYAIKILRNIRDRLFLGVKKENMLMNIQKEIPKEKLYCIHLINGFSLCGHWCFLMEYYPRNLGQALQEQNKSFHIDKVQVLAKQLIMAVIVLRNNNIVHSDIRPSHILINNKNDKLKLCGFDNSYYIEDAILDPYMGHQNYRAPEVMLGHCSGFSLDVWSTALVMYEMATNTVLFPSFDNNDTLFKQMCTLGGIPHTMVANSIFKDDHFYEQSFMRRTGYKKSTIKFINHFYRSKRIPRTIFGAYERDWMKSRTEHQQCEDLEKLGSFLSLLEQMLVIYPRYRLTIEFVYANAFIYE